MAQQTKITDEEAVKMCREEMLSEKEYDDMSMIFEMFGDSTRLKIMNALFEEDKACRQPQGRQDGLLFHGR